MSVNTYSYNLKRVLVAPIFNQDSFRTEFRLGSVGDVILPTLTLLNHGTTGSGTSFYLAPTGLMSIIKQISLYDGNVKLDDLTDFCRTAAFKKFNRNNSSSLNIDHHTDLNAVAFEVEGNATSKGTSADIQGGVQVSRVSSGLIQTTEASTPQGLVNLSEYLSFLKSAPSLPKSVFKNLRLVIDYESSPAQYLQDNNITASTLQPLLAVDVVVDDGMAKALTSQFKGVVWKAIEHDQVLQEAVAEASTRVVENKATKTHTFHGFNNKRVGRVFMAKQPLTTATFTNGTTIFPYGDKTSLSCVGEEVQVRVNGSNKLSRNGMTGKNEMLGMLVDTYGEFVCPAGCNQASVFNMGETAVDANTRYNRDVIAGYDNFKGMQGYIGMDMGGEVINELKVDYTRSGCKDSALNNQAFNLHLFGEVQKSLAVSGSEYVIAYS